jgi:hypothetical protein
MTNKCFFVGGGLPAVEVHVPLDVVKGKCKDVAVRLVKLHAMKMHWVRGIAQCICNLGSSLR